MFRTIAPLVVGAALTLQVVFVTGGISIRSGSGTPEAAVTAPVGSLYLRSNGAAATTLYVKESGSGNTGWVAVPTAPVPFVHEFVAGRCADTTGAAVLFSTPAAATAPTFDCLTETNIRTGEARFDDDGAAREIQGHFTLETDFTGAIDLRGKWRAADTTGSVVWSLNTACVADAEKDPSWNTVQDIVDAAKGTTLQENDFSQIPVTATGCAAGEEFFFRLFRDSDHASDTLATATDGIARLITLRFIVRRTV